MKKFAILCSGGDSQGMNACVKAFVISCISNNIMPIGVRRGYAGLLESDFMELTHDYVNKIELLGGSILKSSRSKEFQTASGVQIGADNLKKFGIDGIVIVGGNGSLRGMEDLTNVGVKAVGIPATIDNDTFYSDYSLGFDTAVQNDVLAIDNMRQSFEANDRTLVVETMGRGCGDIALNTALITGAHSLAVGELNTKISDVKNDVLLAIKSGVKSPLVVVSENCNFKTEEIRKELDNAGIDSRVQILGYIQRGGCPSVLDRKLGYVWGIESVRHLMENKVSVALGFKDNHFIDVPIHLANNTKQNFNINMVKQLNILNGRN